MSVEPFSAVQIFKYYSAAITSIFFRFLSFDALEVPMAGKYKWVIAARNLFDLVMVIAIDFECQ